MEAENEGVVKKGSSDAPPSSPKYLSAELPSGSLSLSCIGESGRERITTPVAVVQVVNESFTGKKKLSVVSISDLEGVR